ncbi:MAG: hypothetical protein U9O87_05640 [Verrucomicrobiota bacterium]|nr:hypothetical protein [Verrucomicrobiota bacterium]
MEKGVHTPIIALTGMTIPDDICQSVGINAILNKPVFSKELEKVINKYAKK